MAGLNDDVEEGLVSLEYETDLTIVEDVFTPEINPSQPEPDEILFLRKDTADSVSERVVSVTEIFGNGLVPGELPNLNAEFELIEQRRTTINDYEETSNIITGNKSISQEDAKLLDAIVPGFINDDRPLGYFTKDSTKTFFNESVGIMNKTIDLEKDKVNELIKEHLNNLSQHYNTLITGFDVKLKPILVEQTKCIKNLLENEIIFSSDISDNFLKEDIGLTDFLNTFIDDIDVNRMIDNDVVAKILIDVKKVFKDKTIRNYFLSFQYHNNGNFISTLSNQNFDHIDISLNTLFNIHKNSLQEKLPFDIYLKLTENEKTINNIRNDYGNYTNRDSIYKTQETFKNDIILLTREFNNINNICKNLYMLNNALIKFLGLFKR